MLGGCSRTGLDLFKTPAAAGLVFGRHCFQLTFRRFYAFLLFILISVGLYLLFRFFFISNFIFFYDRNGKKDTLCRANSLPVVILHFLSTVLLEYLLLYRFFFYFKFFARDIRGILFFLFLNGSGF